MSLVELRRDTTDLERLLACLGPSWRALYTEPLDDPGSNEERVLPLRHLVRPPYRTRLGGARQASAHRHGVRDAALVAAAVHGGLSGGRGGPRARDRVRLLGDVAGGASRGDSSARFVGRGAGPPERDLRIGARFCVRSRRGRSRGPVQPGAVAAAHHFGLAARYGALGAGGRTFARPPFGFVCAEMASFTKKPATSTRAKALERRAKASPTRAKLRQRVRSSWRRVRSSWRRVRSPGEARKARLASDDLSSHSAHRATRQERKAGTSRKAIDVPRFATLFVSVVARQSRSHSRSRSSSGPHGAETPPVSHR